MTSSTPAMTEPPFDQRDPAFVADPYPVFDGLRARSPIHSHHDLGLRVAVAHATCSAVLRDRRLRRVWADVVPLARFERFNALHRDNMLSNPQDHDRLRGALARLFTRGRIRRLHDIVREIATERVDSLCERIAHGGSACFMTHVAGPLPVDVITRMLGFPNADRVTMRDWSNAIVKMYEYGISEQARLAAERASDEFIGYVHDLIQHRRQHPGDDVLSELTTLVDRGESPLTTDELIANYILLLMAGHEATVNGLGNSVVALHQHPEQWRSLCSRLAGNIPALETAADELLRFDTPNQLFERTAVEPVELAGQRLEPGERIAVLLGAANRDPDVFDGPNELDLTRAPNPHLALGAGTHYCLGAPLARLEVASTLGVLAEKLPHFELAETPVRRPEFVIRGWSALRLAAGSA